MKFRAQIAVAALALVTLTGCGKGGSGSGEAGPGWTKVTVGQLTFERPSDWAEEPPVGENWDKRFVGKDIELQVNGEFSEDPTASAALSRLDLPAMQGLDGYDGGGADRIDVEGADTAIRSNFTFKDGKVSKKGAWLIAGQYPYPRTSVISIVGAHLDEATVSHIVESMTFAKKQS